MMIIIMMNLLINSCIPRELNTNMMLTQLQVKTIATGMYKICLYICILMKKPTLVITSHADNEHEVSALTYKGYDSANKVRTFSDDITMSATGGMSGAAANGHTLKLRAGTQYTITVPAGIKATALRIWGYSHYTGNDIYVSELNGTKYSATDYVISAVADSRTNLTIPFGKEVSGSKFTITFTGNSPDVKFFLVDTSVVSGIAAASVTSSHVSAVPTYNLQGLHQLHPH